MKSSHLKVLFVSCVLVALIAIPAISQETGSTPAVAQEASSPASAPAAVSQDKEIAIYGEVQAINVQENTLAVQYYDYDSDSEKTADIAINVNTKLENAVALSDVKKGDWVDVTYTLVEGKNTAKVVTVEKEEVPASDESPAQRLAAPVSVPPEQ